MTNNTVAKVGDIYEFIYPDEPEFSCIVEVTKVCGYAPCSLVVFDDRTHSKQKHLKNVRKLTDITVKGWLSDDN